MKVNECDDERVLIVPPRYGSTTFLSGPAAISKFYLVELHEVIELLEVPLNVPFAATHLLLPGANWSATENMNRAPSGHTTLAP